MLIAVGVVVAALAAEHVARSHFSVASPPWHLVMSG
jgi:hypothetical protein